MRRRTLRSTRVPYTTHFRSQKAQPQLVKFLSKAEVDSWLGGALSGGQSRSVSLPASTTLNTSRLFAFPLPGASRVVVAGDRKSTRLNSSHVEISYAVFCLKN